MNLIVCATIIRNDKVLLVKHSSEQKATYGYWILPAGKVATDESLEEALKREMKEELNLSIQILQKLVEHEDPYTGDQLVGFLCTPLTSTIKISAELKEAKWFNRDKLQKIEEINPNLKQYLLEILKPGMYSQFLWRKS